MIGSAVAEEVGASFSGVPLELELGRTGAYHMASKAPRPN